MHPPSYLPAVSARRLAAWVSAAIAGLLFAHTIVQLLRFTTGNARLYGLSYLFSLGAEGNIPTLYASFSMLFCAFLLATIGLAQRPGQPVSRRYWFGLSLIFGFLAVDELLEVHEKLIDPTREYFGASGALYYAWVIPYSIGALVIVAAYVPFLLRLPRRSAILFVLAGAIFVTGAIGFEMLSGTVYVPGMPLNARYVVIQTFEEVLEMSGTGIFIFALADYIETHLGGISVTIGDDRRQL